MIYVIVIVIVTVTVVVIVIVINYMIFSITLLTNNTITI